MLRHCVMFRWVDGTTEAQKQAVRDGLAKLPGEIPEISSYSFGDDLGLRSGSYDFAVVGEFEDVAAFRAYSDHPVHQAVIADSIRPILAERAVIQYEL